VGCDDAWHLRFDGLTGRVGFDSAGDRDPVTASVGLANWFVPQDGDVSTVERAVWDGSSWVWVGGSREASGMFFNGNRAQPPVDNNNGGTGDAIIAGIASGLVIMVIMLFLMTLCMMHARSKLAERLRHVATGTAVQLAPLAPGVKWHVFLSNAWMSGQDAMRVAKDHIEHLLPGSKIFLDVDDLESGMGAEEVQRSSMMVVYMSEGYLTRANTTRELLRAVTLSLPIVTIYEIEHSDCYSSPEKLQGAIELALLNMHKWQLDTDLRRWQVECPTADALYAALTTHALVWSRNASFRDVTLRACTTTLLQASGSVTQTNRDRVTGSVLALSRQATNHLPSGEHLLSLLSTRSQAKAICVSARLLQKLVCGESTYSESGASLVWAPLSEGKRFHLYASPHNPGAWALTQELAKVLAPLGRMGVELRVTTSMAELRGSMHYLLYLDQHTWTSGSSDALAREVAQALQQGAHLLLAHETEPFLLAPTGTGAHNGIRFEALLSNVSGATPMLLLRRGIYSEIAVALKEGGYRRESLCQLARAVARRLEPKGMFAHLSWSTSKKEVPPASEGSSSQWPEKTGLPTTFLAPAASHSGPMDRPEGVPDSTEFGETSERPPRKVPVEVQASVACRRSNTHVTAVSVAVVDYTELAI